MGLRDLLKKRDDDGDDVAARPSSSTAGPPAFTFVRSDTHSAEIIFPPEGFAHHDAEAEADVDSIGGYLRADDRGRTSLARRSLDVFRSSHSRSASASSGADNPGRSRSRSAHRLSRRLHLRHAPSTSAHVPADLPDIVADDAATADAAGGGDRDGRESQWEKRATMLAMENERAEEVAEKQQQQQYDNVAAERGQHSHSPHPHSPRTPSPLPGSPRAAAFHEGKPAVTNGTAPVSSQAVDADIQEAIRLHEAGDLEASTRLFGRLADPHGTNNPLSQVLYGLALRHGWGCAPDTAAAVRYLTAAASNAAAVERLALEAGLQRGGAAKGELVLAIFELANCFRHGWGIARDPVAAKQYYETAANLGDTDAMNEAAWCYLEGFGCKKDKFASANYYRLAEQNGNKTLGNSWIWKDKYDPDKQKK